MFAQLSPCVNGQESEYPFIENGYESDYSKTIEIRKHLLIRKSFL